MLAENDRHEGAGTLTYNSEWNSLELDGYELHCGESMEVSVFGYWIPGQLALDTAGWYLFTLDQVSIRLQSGLHVRLVESSRSSLPPLLHPSQMHPPHILIVTTIRRCCKPSPTPFLYAYLKRGWIHPTRLKERSS